MILDRSILWDYHLQAPMISSWKLLDANKIYFSSYVHGTIHLDITFCHLFHLPSSWQFFFILSPQVFVIILSSDVFLPFVSISAHATLPPFQTLLPSKCMILATIFYTTCNSIYLYRYSWRASLSFPFFGNAAIYGLRRRNWVLLSICFCFMNEFYNDTNPWGGGYFLRKGSISSWHRCTGIKG